MRRENKEVGAMPTCYCLTFESCKPCLLNFQRFQSCVSWTPFCIFSFCYFSYAVVSGTYPWVYLRQIKSDYHGWLIMMTLSGAPLFCLASGPPNPKSTTVRYWPKLVLAPGAISLLYATVVSSINWSDSVEALRIETCETTVRRLFRQWSDDQNNLSSRDIL